jgi:hypothetical protein
MPRATLLFLFVLFVNHFRNNRNVFSAYLRSTDTLLFNVEINLRCGAVLDDFLAV